MISCCSVGLRAWLAADGGAQRCASAGSSSDSSSNDGRPMMRKSTSMKSTISDNVSQDVSKMTARNRLARKKTVELMEKISGLSRTESILRQQSLRGAVRPIEYFYERADVLGHGAFGQVSLMLSKQKVDGCPQTRVAVKHIPWKADKTAWWSWRPDKQQEEELTKELKMMMILDNPFIVNVREWFEHKCNGIYFVMELCEGGSLQDVLDAICQLHDGCARIKYERRLRRHFREISYALAYLHNTNPPIVHRDLKPDNVLMKSTDSGTCVKLIDFGLTTMANELKSSDENWTKGTQVFMAPEQYLQPPGKFTDRMDIWALGCIFTWMTTAMDLGSLQHPMLSLERGKKFEVGFFHLHCAYKDFKAGTLSWNKDLFRNQPASAIDLADSILRFDPNERLRASHIIDQDWVAEGQLAPSSVLQRHQELFRNMSTSNELSKFDRIILNLVASAACTRPGPAPYEIVSLRQVFQCLDADRRGRISFSNFVEAFEKYHDAEDRPTPEQLRQVFHEIDVDCSDSLDYTEFLAASIGGAVVMDEEAISAAFRSLDSTHTGSINVHDLAEVMGDLAANRFFACQGKEALSYSDFLDLVEKAADKRSEIRWPLSFNRGVTPPLALGGCPQVWGA